MAKYIGDDLKIAQQIRLQVPVWGSKNRDMSC